MLMQEVYLEDTNGRRAISLPPGISFGHFDHQYLSWESFCMIPVSASGSGSLSSSLASLLQQSLQASVKIHQKHSCDSLHSRQKLASKPLLPKQATPVSSLSSRVRLQRCYQPLSGARRVVAKELMRTSQLLPVTALQT